MSDRCGRRPSRTICTGRPDWPDCTKRLRRRKPQPHSTPLSSPCGSHLWSSSVSAAWQIPPWIQQCRTIAADNECGVCRQSKGSMHRSGISAKKSKRRFVCRQASPLKVTVVFPQRSLTCVYLTLSFCCSSERSFGDIPASSRSRTARGFSSEAHACSNRMTSW